jgi:mono/diheme cytochrome c family protein
MRQKWLWLAVALAALVVGCAVLTGHGIGAIGHDPWPGEETVARAAWRLLVPTHAREAANPVPNTPEVLKQARAHWADHCATCHDNDGSGQTTIAARVYPPVPDLRQPRTQRLTDGELFYAIEHGVPWTAMPGWQTGTTEGERESWALVRFVRHLPSVTPDEIKEMEQLNPKPPPNPEREKEIDDFLNGPTKKGRGGEPR